MNANDAKGLKEPEKENQRPKKLLAAFAIALALAGSAEAAPRGVVRDCFADGQINGAHSVEDLRGALAFAQKRTASGPQYSAFFAAVRQVTTDDLVGSGAAAEQQLESQRTPN